MDQPRWLDQNEERAWRAYRRMKTLLDAQTAHDLAADSGLSAPDYDVLSTLTEVEGHRWRSNELADRLLWSRSRLSHHVTRMQRRGLVARHGCEDDGRGAIIQLTARGLRAIEEAAPNHVESVRRYFIDLLSPSELSALETIAHKVSARINQDRSSHNRR